ncbi:MAG TPA: ECF transporter S component [Capillimicrobium sp.]|nr:ECF transporter S component [Capillimicrobium sp.]
MNWTLAALVVLGVCLFAGFWWYERQHPPAKVVALVATLAALAALGRIAFAPIPSVKPTTAIVLIAGFALGAAPGFTVGAVAALASNLFFGQGPWTPWQMVAWGLVGVAGALLAAAHRDRPPGRVALGVACAVAALGFGAVMDLSTWTTFGRHTLGEYLAISATALPFNLTHAAGSFAFALAFGPALLATLERFRMRFEIEWVPAPSSERPVAPPIG